MGILVVGSVALDTVETPFGKIVEGLGGSATHFSMSASYHTDVSLVAVVGEDFPQAHLDLLKSRQIDIGGIQKVPGRTFRWEGKYDYDLNNSQTIKTELNGFDAFKPVIESQYKKPDFLFLSII